MDEKVCVSENGVPLWSQILISGVVLLPEWEIGNCSDVSELIEKGLVTVSGGAQSRMLTPANISPLSEDERKVLFNIRMAGKPIDLRTLFTGGRGRGVRHPLRALKRLMDLDLVSFDGNNKRSVRARF